MTRRLSTLVLAISSLASACDAGTGGALVDIEIELAADPPQNAPTAATSDRFETRLGWQVVLEEAKLALGPAFVWAPEQARAQQRFGFVSVARAHGGYDPFSGRRVRIELAEQVVLDALAAQPVSLGSVTAEAGPVDTAAVQLDPPRRQAAIETHDHHVWLRGTAERDGQQVTFAGGVDIEDDGLLRRVNGIAARFEIVASGTLTLAVTPSLWVDDIRFERLRDEDGDGVADLHPDTQPYDAVFLGVSDPGAYRVDFRAPD